MKLAALFSGHSDRVRGASFSPDGRSIISWGVDKTIRLWDVLSQKEIKRSEVDPASFVAISPDGKRAVFDHRTSIFDNPTLRICEIATGKQLQKISLEGACAAAAFSFDGSKILSANGNQVSLWDANTGNAIRHFKGHTSDVKAVAFSPDNKSAFSSGDHIRNDGTRQWDLTTGNEVQWIIEQGATKPEGYQIRFYNIGFAPNGRYARAFRKIGMSSEILRIWELPSWTELRPLLAGSVLAFSQDGQQLQSSQSPGGIIQGDIPAFSGDGRHLVTCDGTWLRLFDLSAPRELRICRAGNISSLAISPTGMYAVSGGADANVRLWDLSS